MDTENVGGTSAERVSAPALQQHYAAMSAAAEAEDYTPIDELEDLEVGQSTSAEELLALIDELPAASSGP